VIRCQTQRGSIITATIGSATHLLLHYLQPDTQDSGDHAAQAKHNLPRGASELQHDSM
jgi:hypothetical protein